MRAPKAPHPLIQTPVRRAPLSADSLSLNRLCREEPQEHRSEEGRCGRRLPASQPDEAPRTRLTQVRDLRTLRARPQKGRRPPVQMSCSRYLEHPRVGVWRDGHARSLRPLGPHPVAFREAFQSSRVVRPFNSAPARSYTGKRPQIQLQRDTPRPYAPKQLVVSGSYDPLLGGLTCSPSIPQRQ